MRGAFLETTAKVSGSWHSSQIHHLDEQAVCRQTCDTTPGAGRCHTYDVPQHVVVHVEVGRVGRTAHVRNIGRLQVPDVLPVQPLEEGVLLEVLHPVLPQPALPAADQPLDEVFGLLGHIRDVGRELKPLLGGQGAVRGLQGAQTSQGTEQRQQLQSHSHFLCPSKQVQPKLMKFHSRKPLDSPVLLMAALLPRCM